MRNGFGSNGGPGGPEPTPEGRSKLGGPHRAREMFVKVKLEEIEKCLQTRYPLVNVKVELLKYVNGEMLTATVYYTDPLLEFLLPPGKEVIQYGVWSSNDDEIKIHFHTLEYFVENTRKAVDRLITQAENLRTAIQKLMEQQ